MIFLLHSSVQFLKSQNICWAGEKRQKTANAAKEVGTILLVGRAPAWGWGARYLVERKAQRGGRQHWKCCSISDHVSGRLQDIFLRGERQGTARAAGPGLSVWAQTMGSQISSFQRRAAWGRGSPPSKSLLSPPRICWVNPDIRPRRSRRGQFLSEGWRLGVQRDRAYFTARLVAAGRKTAW